MARDTKYHIEGDETTHFVSQRKKRERPKAKMQPPLTPMIDVTFQLLLFFLLAFNFRLAEGQIPGTLPTKSEDDPVVTDLLPITINVIPAMDAKTQRMTGCLYDVDKVSVSIKTPRKLYELLEGRKLALGEAATKVPVIIKPRDDVAWRHALEAFNAAVLAKYKNVVFVAED